MITSHVKSNSRVVNIKHAVFEVGILYKTASDKFVDVTVADTSAVQNYKRIPLGIIDSININVNVSVARVSAIGEEFTKPVGGGISYTGTIRALKTAYFTVMRFLFMTPHLFHKLYTQSESDTNVWVMGDPYYKVFMSEEAVAARCAGEDGCGKISPNAEEGLTEENKKVIAAVMQFIMRPSTKVTDAEFWGIDSNYNPYSFKLYWIIKWRDPNNEQIYFELYIKEPVATNWTMTVNNNGVVVFENISFEAHDIKSRGKHKVGDVLKTWGDAVLVASESGGEGGVVQG